MTTMTTTIAARRGAVVLGTLLAALAAGLGSLVSASCKGAGTTSGAGAGAGAGAGGGDAGNGGEKPSVEVLEPDAEPLPGETACTVTITRDIAVSGTHFELCTPVEYPHDPPAGGPHWPVWAQFAKHSAVVPREMYVHSMEHGGVMLLHRCSFEEPGCAEVIAALDEAFDGATSDSLCAATGIDVRLLRTRDPLLSAPLALAAWGATYVATCIDPPSIAAFIAERYDRAPESTCATGTSPSSVMCGDAGVDDAGAGGAGGAASDGG